MDPGERPQPTLAGSPLEVVGRVVAETIEVAQHLPGMRLTRSLFGQLERMASRSTARLADAVEDVQHVALGSMPAGRGASDEDRRAGHPGRTLADLLARGYEQTSTEARAEALQRSVGELVPDEAKIIALLANAPAALVDVEARPLLGGTPELVIKHQTNLAHAAGLRSRDLAPAYVAHLLELGLICAGPEDASLNIDYEITEATHEVRTTVHRLEESRGQRVKVIRRTLALTPLGQQLWQAYLEETASPREG